MSWLDTNDHRRESGWLDTQGHCGILDMTVPKKTISTHLDLPDRLPFQNRKPTLINIGFLSIDYVRIFHAISWIPPVTILMMSHS